LSLTADKSIDCHVLICIRVLHCSSDVPSEARLQLNVQNVVVDEIMFGCCDVQTFRYQEMHFEIGRAET